MGVTGARDRQLGRVGGRPAGRGTGALVAGVAGGGGGGVRGAGVAGWGGAAVLAGGAPGGRGETPAGHWAFDEGAGRPLPTRAGRIRRRCTAGAGWTAGLIGAGAMTVNGSNASA